jgi:acyl-CoA synthetase (AMP-forming)/AMP-acid ligase II
VFTGGQLTYRELDRASDRLAATLAATGIKPGDPVALQLPNIGQFLIAYFGILKSGGVVVPLNVLLKARASGSRRTAPGSGSSTSRPTWPPTRRARSSTSCGRGGSE